MSTPKEVLKHNRDAWNREVAAGNPWTLPVTTEQIEAARRGDWSVVLTEMKSVPRDWFPELDGKDVLCLASGGGQQGPTLAAAGARVTVYDLSPAQLARDREVAEREGLELTTVEGDMARLEAFSDEAFDLVFHPTSNLFVPDIRPVWREAYRVLRPGGTLLAGCLQPTEYVFDRLKADNGEFELRFAIPYSDLTSITAEERARTLGHDEALEFGHSLTDQLGAQMEAGFVLLALYEDYRKTAPIRSFMPSYLATRALKPPR